MNDILIYDLETQTFGRPDGNKDVMKFFGCYSYKTKKFYMLQDKQDIQRVLNAHKYLVGFNNKQYDDLILKREGFDINYKVTIDLMEIFKKRAGSMKINKGMLGDLLMSYSLEYITKTLDLIDDGTKLKIDFNIFKKDVWTPEEVLLIREYLERDIMLTKKLYDWCEEYFESFKEYLTEDDVRRKVYLTASTASFTYKAMCKELMLEPTYDDTSDDTSTSYEGGYVAYPAGEKFEGSIEVRDFTSMYPFNFMQCNLFSHSCTCCKEEEKWHGGGFFNVEGYYCTKKQGRVEELYKKLFLLRRQYKKEKNNKEYSVKLLLNSGYGVTANPCFKNLYNKVGASDCCLIGRQMILYVRKRFREEGYINLASDTDSNIVKRPLDKTVNDTNELCKKILLELQQYMPFPSEYFELKLEDELKYAYFFKGKAEKDDDDVDDVDDIVNKKLSLLKKNYILVTKDDKVIIKNLGIRKKSNSEVSKKIFWEHIVPKLKVGQSKFSKVYIVDQIKVMIGCDIKMALLRKDVDEIKVYANDTSLASQISCKYGAGIHFLIPNIRGVGVGKGKSFCTLEEFEENKLTADNIDYTGYLKELEYFIKPAVTKSIFDY